MSRMFEQLKEALDDADQELIRRLLSEGADPNETDDIGYGPMHEYHDVEIYRLLVEAGGNVNSVSGGGTRALAECASLGDIPCVTYLLSAGAKPDLEEVFSWQALPLHMAVAGGSIEIVKLLLDAGADINLQDGDQWTCLWWADSVPIAIYLLEHGADPSISSLGKLPEDWDGRPEPVRELLKQHRLRKTIGNGF